MSKTNIPFMEMFRKPMLEGTKYWTSRTRKYGKAGDIFEAFGQTFCIIKITQRTLGEVSEHYIEEGASSKEEFIALWNKLHPVKGFVPDQIVFVHEFCRVMKLE